MEQLLKLNLELKKINIFNISVIKDFNNYVSDRFEKLFRVYNSTSNKFYMLEELVKFGIILENISDNKDDFVSEQLSTFSNLFNPIVLKIKEVCFELNNQIVNDLKLSYDNMIELEPSYKDNIKIFKSIQIFSNVKFYYSSKPREIPFDEFGVSIKIPNPNDKHLFKNIIDSFGIFSLPTLVLSKKMDWMWKALNYNSNINENLSYLKWVCDVNVKKLEIIIEKNIDTINEHNYINKSNNNGDCDYDCDNDNDNDNVPSITLIKNILKQNNSGYNYDFMKKQVGENLLETNLPIQSNEANKNVNTSVKLTDMVVIEDDTFKLEIQQSSFVQEKIIISSELENELENQNDIKSNNKNIIIETSSDYQSSGPDEDVVINNNIIINENNYDIANKYYFETPK